MGRGVGPDNREGVIASNSIMRGTWDGKGLTDIKDIFVADDVDMEVSRLAFGADGMLYMSIGGPGTGGDDSLIRPQHLNDYAGKILRMRDDGSVPQDNPFVGQEGREGADLLDGPSQPARHGDEPVDEGDLVGRAGAERRRRDQHHPRRQELRLAARQRWPRLPRAVHLAVALQGRHGATARRLRAVDRHLQHRVLHRRQVSQLAAQSVRRAACAKARLPAPASSYASSSTTSGRKCDANRCCAICTSASATSARGRTGCIYVITDEGANSVLLQDRAG